MSLLLVFCPFTLLALHQRLVRKTEQWLDMGWKEKKPLSFKLCKAVATFFLCMDSLLCMYSQE